MNKMKEVTNPTETTETVMSSTSAAPKIQRKYKDTLFSMLFSEKKNLLSLYNALSKTAYTNVDDLEITTLENALYAQFVYQVREFAIESPIKESVENAVEYCIEHDILVDFLSKYSMEAVDMCIFEFNEEKFLKSEREWAREEGRKEGHASGLEEGVEIGEQRLLQLLSHLQDSGRNEDLSRALSDKGYREQLYQQFNL